MPTYEIIAYSTTRATSYITANSAEEAERLWRLGLDDETTEYSQPTEFEIDEVNEIQSKSATGAYGDYLISSMETQNG